MSEARSGPPIVAYVGRGPAIDPDGRFRLERVDPASVASYASHADCVVLEEPGGGLDALERLRGTSTPTVLYDRTADPAVAARATRAGVTEYVVDGGAERPIDRIAAVAGAGDGRAPESSRATDLARPDQGRFRHLFDALPDPVVDVEFTDRGPIVRRVNGAFERTFGYDDSSIRDRPLNEAIVPAERLDECTLRGGNEAAEIERLTADGRRTFLFRGFSYRYDGTERGFGVYTDVTDRLEQERRLRVLHRVLRHNLRNEMTAIIGYADMLAETAESEACRDHAERIHRQAMNVSELGEQVRRIQQALDIDRKRVPMDPEPLVTDIADRFRSTHPETTIRVSGGGDGAVVGDELLKIAIENLIENAIEHHPGAATVDIEVATAKSEWIDITVRDDGPGIPERERAVVSGSREITQLDHSVGLGLWLSRWVVRGVDGQLLFGDCETGSEVTLRLRQVGGRSPDRG